MKSISRSRPALIRLGICFLAILIVNIYVDYATRYDLRFTLVFGVVIMSAYCWLVAISLPSIYPYPSRAFGNLFFTFLLITLWSMVVIIPLKKSIKSGVAITHAIIYKATLVNAKGTLAGAMITLTALFYLISKFIKRGVIEDPAVETPKSVDSPL